MTKSPEDEELAQRELDRFFERLDRVDTDVPLVMGAAWHSADPQEREDAWKQVRALGRRAALGRRIDEARERALQWAQRPGQTYSDLTLYGGGLDPIWNDARRQAAPAIIDAAVAIVLGDHLDEKSRDVLLGPWLRAVEQPEA
jgi:hypothetical protein